MDEELGPILGELKKDREILRERVRTRVTKKSEETSKARYYPSPKDQEVETLEAVGALIAEHPDVPTKWWVFVLRSDEPSLASTELRAFLSAMAALRKPTTLT